MAVQVSGCQLLSPVSYHLPDPKRAIHLSVQVANGDVEVSTPWSLH